MENFHFSNHFYHSQCILGAPLYILIIKQALLVIDVALVYKVQLTGKRQLLPSS